MASSQFNIMGGTPNHQTLTTDIIYTKNNGIVDVIFQGANPATFTNGQFTSIGTLPSGYRPITTEYNSVSLGVSATILGTVRVQESGAISVFQRSGADTNYIFGRISFFSN